MGNHESRVNKNPNSRFTKKSIGDPLKTREVQTTRFHLFILFSIFQTGLIFFSLSRIHYNKLKQREIKIELAY